MARANVSSSISDDPRQDILYYGIDAINDPRGLCPCGWRLPSKRDFDELQGHIEGVAKRNEVGGKAVQEDVTGGNLTQSGQQYGEFDVDFFGYTSAVTGSIEGRPDFSYYWGGDCGPLGCDVFVFEKGGDKIKKNVGIRGYAFSVRCVADRK